ncbi:hypothetical protein [Pseudonocardia sp. EC080625-04]|uniref:hypothetical protein n=1 Tax=Pseudonocardia sp. EC080625-04 TaxID=1096868 RepID=UPI000761B0F2|nr:hypothetical protein [Pseudonocardia sp. EC080625-04]
MSQTEARAAPTPAGRGTPPRCDDCRRNPRHPGERADIATTWILAGPTGPVTGHFCRDCAPTGPVADLTCTRCGDGPLLAGDIAENPEQATPLLTAAGWQLTGPATCPSCCRVTAGLPHPRRPGRTR